jgi:RecB family endonuclease NucS
MRLIVARCSVSYTGRLSTELPEGLRLIMIRADGTVMIFSDSGGHKVKPLELDDPADGDRGIRRRHRRAQAQGR